MKKKFLSVIMCAAVAVSAFAGCGGSGSGTESNTDMASDSATPEKSESDSGDKIHLEFFNVKSEVVDIYDELIEKFEEENPDIEIEQINVPDPTTVLQTRMSTNDMPDILSHWATDPVFKEMVNNDSFKE